MAIDIPRHIGSAEFSRLGSWVAVRCPRSLDGIMRQAGAEWDAGARRWLIEPRRIGPVIRTLERWADPLFQQVGIRLD